MTIQAFGPFAGVERIDFTHLPQRAPFTISGPTGAGKTAILDAMCVALFGKTSGGERQAAEMRSQHAAKDVPTEVTLDFALGQTVWKVVRRPPTAEVSQSARLSRQLGPEVWQDDAQRLGDVNDKIGKLLGFSVEQFRQVVVLPQGAFRQLLSAGSKDREDILKQLFATQLYESIQLELKGRESALGKQAELLNERRKALLGQFDAKDVAELDAQVARVDAGLLVANADAADAIATRSAAQAALQAGEADAQRLQVAASAAQQLAAHEQTRPQQQLREGNIAAALRAQQVVAADQLAQRAAQQAAGAKDAADKAKKEHQLALPKLAAAQADLQKQRENAPQRDALTAQAQALEGMRDKVGALDLARVAAAAAQQALETATKARQDNASAALDLQDQLPKLQASVDTLRGLAATAAGLQAHVAKLERVRRLAAAVGGEQAKHASLQRQHTEAAAALTQAGQAAGALLSLYDQCHQAWVSGQAARLAATLQAGEPCAVCGSRDHPQPAVSGGALPSDAQLEEAKGNYERARSLASEGEVKAQRLAAQVDAAAAAVDAASQALAEESLNPALADDAALQAARRAVQQAETAAAKVAAAVERVTAAETALHGLGQAAPGLEAAVTAATAAAATAAERVASLLTDVPEALRSPAALEQAITSKTTAAAQLQAALDTAQQAATAAGEACAGSLARQKAADAVAVDADLESTRCAGELAATLDAHGFASHAQWQAARLSVETLAQQQQQAQVWRDAATSFAAMAAQAAERAAGIVAPDLPMLTQVVATAKTADSAAQQHVARLQAQRDQLRQTAQALADLAVRAGDLEARHLVVKELAATCNGNNPKNLALQRFVLAGLLDDVLCAANVRLSTMTRGRYALQRVGALADRRKVGGLDLEVADSYTGQQRAATTLSGGEGFMAALALALGLSDVVQGYSGGIRLDALFIDEGFGTLDPEALDLAISALMALSQTKDAGGRMVGVISHVPELKARLARGIDVVVGADGKGSSICQPRLL